MIPAWTRRGLIGAGAAFAAAGAPAATPAGMLLGVQTHFSQRWPLSWLDRARDVGATALRDGLAWRAIETRPGLYAFDRYHGDFLERARARGLGILLTIDPRHPLHDGGATAFSPRARAAYAGYLNALLDRYGDVVGAIEIGNELNTANGMSGPAAADRAAACVVLLRTVWETVKPRHPRVQLLGASTNVIGAGFLEAIFAAGGLAVMDGVAVHPYRRHAEHVDTELAVVREAMARHGRVLPIWCTEFSDQFETPDEASPHLLKMAALMGAAGVRRAYWYALSDQKWFRNMGLFTGQQEPKPAAETFALLQRDLLPLGDPVRLPSDRRTFLFRYGPERLVAWGADRPIRFPGQIRARDARGRAIPTPGRLSANPVVFEGRTAFELGDSPVLADSFLEYGEPPWSYFALAPDGGAYPLRRVDWDWTSYIGDRRFQPLRFNADGVACAGDGRRPVRAMLRYTAPEAAAAELSLSLTASGRGDGLDLEVRHNTRSLLRQPVRGVFAHDGPALKIAAGDHIDVIVGPNAEAGGDVARYRVRLTRHA
jgi:hypothetical protein